MAMRRLAVGTLLGPTFVGKVYDLSGRYDGAFFAAGGIALLGVPLFCLAVFCRRSIEKPSLVMEAPAKADHRDHVIPSCDAPDEFQGVNHVKCLNTITTTPEPSPKNGVKCKL